MVMLSFFLGQEKQDFDESKNLYLFERRFKPTSLQSILNEKSHLRSIFSYRFYEMHN